MSAPTISIISSAARPENWQGLYENIGENDVSCEFIFVGPNAPKWELPDNFTYIKSNVKPAQCFEIAARHANGKLLLWIADDSLYVTKRPLDKLYDYYQQHDNENVIVSSNYDLPDGWNRFFLGDPDSPTLALSGLMSKKLWRHLGGIDSRFIALCWAEDISMSVRSIGGDIILSDVYMDEEVEKAGRPRSRGSTLLRDHKSTDRKLLEELWVTDTTTHFNRSLPVDPFSDVDILTRSQDPQGRWRYQSGLINRFMTSSAFYSMKTFRSGITGRMGRFKFKKTHVYVRRLFKR